MMKKSRRPCEYFMLDCVNIMLYLISLSLVKLGHHVTVAFCDAGLFLSLSLKAVTRKRKR